MTSTKNTVLSAIVAFLMAACATTSGYPPGAEKGAEESGADHAGGREVPSTGADNPDAVNTNIDVAGEGSSPTILAEQSTDEVEESATNTVLPEPYLPKPYDSRSFTQDQLKFGGRSQTPRDFARHLRDSLASQGYEKVSISKSDNAWHFTTQIERINEDGSVWKNSVSRFDFEKSLKLCHDDGANLVALFRNWRCVFPHIKKGHYKVYIFSLLPTSDEVPFAETQQVDKKLLDDGFNSGNIVEINGDENDKFERKIGALGFGQKPWKVDIAFYRFHIETADRERKTLHHGDGVEDSDKDICLHLGYTHLNPQTSDLGTMLLKEGC